MMEQRGRMELMATSTEANEQMVDGEGKRKLVVSLLERETGDFTACRSEAKPLMKPSELPARDPINAINKPSELPPINAHLPGQVISDTKKKTKLDDSDDDGDDGEGGGGGAIGGGGDGD